MEMHRIIRGVAGAFILISLFLAVVFSNWWLLVTLFVGANLLQSAFTDTCPLMSLMRKVKSD
jgi:hypothetical protein